MGWFSRRNNSDMHLSTRRIGCVDYQHQPTTLHRTNGDPPIFVVGVGDVVRAGFILVTVTQDPARA
jgi:hypothetical protein